MSRYDGSALMFDDDEVRQVRVTGADSLLPRLVRVIFRGLRISNDNYLSRYHHYFRESHPNKSRKEFNLKASSDRRGLMDRHKLTFSMLTNVMRNLGFDVEMVTIDVRDRLTGKTYTFSTNDTLETLKEMEPNDDAIGSQSVM